MRNVIIYFNSQSKILNFPLAIFHEFVILYHLVDVEYLLLKNSKITFTKKLKVILCDDYGFSNHAGMIQCVVTFENDGYIYIHFKN